MTYFFVVIYVNQEHNHIAKKKKKNWAELLGSLRIKSAKTKTETE